MLPAYPPLPVPSNRPFHPELGIQSSMLITESGVGFETAETLQNGGTSYVCPFGAMNDGPGIDVADMIVASGSGSVTRLSQLIAHTDCAPSIIPAAKIAEASFRTVSQRPLAGLRHSIPR